jgi:hypothetical protein
VAIMATGYVLMRVTTPDKETMMKVRLLRIFVLNSAFGYLYTRLCINNSLVYPWVTKLICVEAHLILL